MRILKFAMQILTKKIHKILDIVWSKKYETISSFQRAACELLANSSSISTVRWTRGTHKPVSNIEIGRHKYNFTRPYLPSIISCFLCPMLPEMQKRVDVRARAKPLDTPTFRGWWEREEQLWRTFAVSLRLYAGGSSSLALTRQPGEH